jgi:hypothetical protein
MAMTTQQFEDLQQLTDYEVQRLLREVDQADLVTALGGSSDALRETFLRNMSSRVRSFITEQLASRGQPDPGTAEATQLRILQQLVQLAGTGVVTWPKSAALPGEAALPALDEELQQLTAELRNLAGQPLDRLSHDEIVRLFGGFCRLSRSRGILALKEVEPHIADPYLQLAIGMALDGTEPDIIVDELRLLQASKMHEIGSKYAQIQEGIRAVQLGIDPQFVERRLRRIY